MVQRMTNHAQNALDATLEHIEALVKCLDYDYDYDKHHEIKSKSNGRKSMTTKDKALEQALEQVLDALKLGEPVTSSAAAKLRRQQHEIERLNAALKWEQDRSEHIGTHGQGCHTWGHRHYECLLREYNVLLDALKDIAERAERYTAPGHPIATMARAAFAKATGEQA